MTDELKNKIQKLVTDNRVFLFMKGTPEMPQCGFSKAVVDVLKKHSVEFGAFDVLSDGEVREGVKEFSNWPTIPQLYVNGEFVGGCDIVREMDKSGELTPILGK